MQNVKALFKNYSNITGVAFIYINHGNIINIYKMVLGGFFLQIWTSWQRRLYIYIFILIHFFLSDLSHFLVFSGAGLP